MCKALNWSSFACSLHPRYLLLSRHVLGPTTVDVLPGRVLHFPTDVDDNVSIIIIIMAGHGVGSAVTVAILVDGWLLLLLRLLLRLAELKDVEAAEEDFPNRHSVTAVVVHGLPIISQLIRWRVGVEIWNAIRYSIYGRVRSNERTLWWTEIGCVIRESVRETRRTNEWADKRMDRRTGSEAGRQDLSDWIRGQEDGAHTGQR